MNQLGNIERRRRNLRIGLFSVILVTLPLYCLGFLLWGTAPLNTNRTPTTGGTTSVVTLQTSATNTVAPTWTQFAFPTQVVPTFQPPQYTFVPPPTQVIFPSPVPPTATDFVFPTSTIAPTLTPFPTLTPAPTDTSIPLPTIEPPTAEPPTATATMTETPTPTATGEEPTPIPFE